VDWALKFQKRLVNSVLFFLWGPQPLHRSGQNISESCHKFFMSKNPNSAETWKFRTRFECEPRKRRTILLNPSYRLQSPHGFTFESGSKLSRIDNDEFREMFVTLVNLPSDRTARIGCFSNTWSSKFAKYLDWGGKLSPHREWIFEVNETWPRSRKAMTRHFLKTWIWHDNHRPIKPLSVCDCDAKFQRFFRAWWSAAQHSHYFCFWFALVLNGV
jgi:hypothetical protein